MVITDIRAHVLDTETPALVTSFDGLFHNSGAAGTIQYTLVRLLTDTELEGHYIVWSEVASGRPPALAEVLRAMKPLVVGEDPLNREKLWYRLGTLWYGEKGSAFAAIDVALWDLAAKAAGLPLWRYLGAYRDRIRAYASGNVPHDEGDIVRIAKDLKQRGYTAMKLHPIPIELCPALRDAVGPDVDLIYDAVFAHTRQEALAVGRELERLGYFWYEAPLPPDDIDGYVDLRRRVDVPLTVELIYATQYREYVRRQAVTYLRTLSGIDRIRTLIMPEESTFVAALRTRRLDFTGVLSGSSITSLDNAESLRRTNPEIVQWPHLNRSDNSHVFNVAEPPFDDLRVRKAMQMALDLDTINNTYFKGLAVSTPYGLLRVPGHHTPFAEWPEEVKKGYMYDPEGAEKLLDEAGYPRGSDGVRFETTVNHNQGFDLNYQQIAAEYWREIGVDVEIEVLDGATLTAGRQNSTFEGMTMLIAALTWSPTAALKFWYSEGGWTADNINDADYDAMYDAAAAAATPEELQKLAKELDMYEIERHWHLWGPMVPQFIAHQPWVIGYNGEVDLGRISQRLIYARLWIDSELKEEMGQ